MKRMITGEISATARTVGNRKTAYLRHSADQKIDWYPWCEEAFERAKQEVNHYF